MSPTLVAGGMTDEAPPKVAEVAEDAGGRRLTMRYVRSAPAGSSYEIFIAPRLSVIVERGEGVWVAWAPEVNGLGYGDSVNGALATLRESVGQYLEYLREEKPPLAPEVAGHSAFVQLLDTWPALWFASVNVVHASAVE